ncbi:unnamed protein product [Ceutorhynchus assimilis]|uniref:Uncharacterized protein n=1 Tax=Ceutorhynchus assimilis TaxID=467358 RepID=A0A9N9QN46_9CUCU|nr:unnamed protein product [Ceutorhynchus assimilis]
MVEAVFCDTRTNIEICTTEQAINAAKEVENGTLGRTGDRKERKTYALIVDNEDESLKETIRKFKERVGKTDRTKHKHCLRNQGGKGVDHDEKR